MQNSASLAENSKKYPRSADLHLPDLNIGIVGCDDLQLPDLNIGIVNCDDLQLPDLNIRIVGCDENNLTDESNWPAFTMTSQLSKNVNSQLPNNDVPMNHEESVVYIDHPTLRSKNFNTVLLRSKNKNESVWEAIQENIKKKSHEKIHGKKKRNKRNTNEAYLSRYLTKCAKAVADDNRNKSNKYLKRIRQHSSPMGDGMERLAYYFVDALEARMIGYGTHIYKELISFPVSAADVLKSYELYDAACPYSKISTSFSNKTIRKAVKNAPRLHIVDFGILYGFQWPSLIERLSSRPGGPPTLRITGIDFPHPGFRPSQRVDETGLLLASYAETFKVPFEFHAIAQKWETIRIEDLHIRDDEVLVVNCLYRLTNLLDETVVINSPRNTVFNLIRQMNPHTFIMGMVHGLCNNASFPTRFQGALLYYSALFNMLDAIIPREIHERMLLEKDFFAKEAKNVIACEGVERIVRPETYHQWHVITEGFGFRQLPLNKRIVDSAEESVKAYHNDFMVYTHNHWLLQAWKGRTMCALSSWRSG